MRQTIKVIGNAVELPSGKIVRANDFIVEIGDTSIRGDIFISYAQHQHHLQANTAIMCTCGMCKK